MGTVAFRAGRGTSALHHKGMVPPRLQLLVIVALPACTGSRQYKVLF